MMYKLLYLLTAAALCGQQYSITENLSLRTVNFDGKCPQCKAEGQPSTVTVGMTTSTLVASIQTYDENGSLKPWRDPNVITTQYQCSRGHSFSSVSGGDFNYVPAVPAGKTSSVKITGSISLVANQMLYNSIVIGSWIELEGKRDPVGHSLTMAAGNYTDPSAVKITVKKPPTITPNSDGSYTITFVSGPASDVVMETPHFRLFYNGAFEFKSTIKVNAKSNP
jgi:hypothetical protein